MLAPRNWTHSIIVATVSGAAMQFLAASAVSAEWPVVPPPSKMVIYQQQIDEAYAEGCPSLPQVVWWNTSHRKIIKFVNERYNGAWDSYIRRWVNYRNEMQRILEDNGTAVIRSKGLHLKGLVLANHISDIERRIRVTRCLKIKFGRRLAATSGVFSTTSGCAGVDALGARRIWAKCGFHCNSKLNFSTS